MRSGGSSGLDMQVEQIMCHPDVGRSHHSRHPTALAPLLIPTFSAYFDYQPFHAIHQPSIPKKHLFLNS
jgi:hypothetical protein